MKSVITGLFISFVTTSIHREIVCQSVDREFATLAKHMPIRGRMNEKLGEKHVALHKKYGCYSHAPMTAYGDIVYIEDDFVEGKSK